MVGDYAAAVSHGLISEGIAPSAKHFPGHGDTHVDSHLALPRILKSKTELEEMELVPFKKLIDAKIASIMIGHMALPLLTGGDAPASTSEVVITTLLRRELAYEGVLVTDCMEMDAISDVEEGAVRSLVAGVDIVMACHTFERHVGMIHKVYEAVEEGRLDVEVLKKGGTRITTMKSKFVGGWKDVLDKEDDETFGAKWRKLKEINMEVSIQAYRRSCTIVWGSEILPLKISAKEVMLFTPEMESLNRAVDDADGVLRDRAGRVRNTAGASYLALAKEVEKKAKSRHVVYSKEDTEVENMSKEVGAVMLVLRNADQREWQREYMKKVIKKSNGIPVVLVSSCGPYDLVGVEVEKGTTAYLASFEFTREGLSAVVELVFELGGRPGKMPVKLM
jgi:beta-N-acetylhexosaminidase